MQEYTSHDIKGYALGISLLLSFSSFAQCPFTESVLLPLDAAGQASVQISDFLTTPSSSTDFTISKQLFDCQNLGVQEVLLEGLTADQEAFSCKEFVVVYDTTNYCKQGANAPKAILGKIVTETGEAVQNVTVGLASDDMGFFRGTNEDGLYLFDDVPSATYQVLPTKNNDIKNGITTQDILYLQRHLLGIRTIKSPYQLIAADINNSGDITAYDMILLRQLILKSIDRFPDNTSWKFIRTDFKFSEKEEVYRDLPNNTYRVTYDASISMNNNFIGIKIGDLNNSVVANQNQGSRSRSNATPAFILQLDNKAFEKGEVFTIDVTGKEAIELAGFQLSLNINNAALSFLEVEGVAKEAYHYNSRHQLSISVVSPFGTNYNTNESIFRLTFKANTTGLLADYISVNSENFSNEFYDLAEQKSPINISFLEISPSIISFANYPNPFTEKTYLPFILPQTGEVFLNIYDTQGREVWTTQQTFSAGRQDFEIKGIFPSSGVYFYQLAYADKVLTGKLNYME